MSTTHTRFAALAAIAALAAALAAPARADTAQYDNFEFGSTQSYGSAPYYGSAGATASAGRSTYGTTQVSPSADDRGNSGFNFTNLPRDTRNEGFNTRYGLDWTGGR